MTGKKVFGRKADLQEIIEHFNVGLFSYDTAFLIYYLVLLGDIFRTCCSALLHLNSVT